MTTPAVAGFSFPSLDDLVADFRKAEPFIPVALGFLGSNTRAQIAKDASILIEICLALGGTLPGTQPAAASGGTP